MSRFRKRKASTVLVAVTIFIALSLLSNVATSMSKTTVVIQTTGIVAGALSGTVYAKINFETDQWLTEVQNNGAFCYFNGTWNHEPNPLYTEIVNDTALERRQACKFIIPDPSTNQRSKVCMVFLKYLNLTEAYFGFSIFIPKDFALTSSSDWFNFIESDVNPSTRASWAIIQDSSTWYVYTMIGDRRVVWNAGQLLPEGVWIDFVVYCLYDSNGNVKVWVDGNLVCNLFYDTTGGEGNPYVEFGAYEASCAPPNWVIFDHVVAASTYQICQMSDRTTDT